MRADRNINRFSWILAYVGQTRINHYIEIRQMKYPTASSFHGAHIGATDLFEGELAIVDETFHISCRVRLHGLMRVSDVTRHFEPRIC